MQLELKSALKPAMCSLAAAIQPRVLVHAHGSGNYGESGSSAFYTIDTLPQTLVDMPPPERPLVRTDLELDRLAFFIDDVLSEDEADALAACGESIFALNGHSRMAPGIQTPPGMRQNMAAHWYPSAQEAQRFLGPLYERFRHLVPPTLGGTPLHDTLNEKIAIFKYDVGDQFKRHTDGFFPGQGCNEQGDGVDSWEGVQSGMSILLYLNGESDGIVGGHTRLWSADGSRHVDVAPRKGRALFFRHGYGHDSVMHAGGVVEAGSEPKMIARINLLYGERRGSEPMY